jgi:hypothetical protein
MQNIRRYRDTHNRWPHLANAVKYSFSQSVVLFSVANPSINHAGNKPGLVRRVVCTECVLLHAVKTWLGLGDWSMRTQLTMRSTPHSDTLGAVPVRLCL